MKVLFGHPFFLSESVLEQELQTFYFPLGLLYLAAMAREAGHAVAVFDATFAAGDEAFMTALAQHQPDVVCLASLITLRSTAHRLAQRAAEQGALVVVGGPDPTFDPEAYLADPAIQIVVSGEGEQTLVELLDAVQKGNNWRSVAGLVYRQGETVVQTGKREPIWDLDTLPWPARDLIDMQPYLHMWKQAHGYSSMTLAVSRGCPYGCEYCADSVMGPHLRRRQPEQVAAEMQHLQERYAPDRFRLVDDLEGLGRDWLEALGQAMIQAGVTIPYEGLKPVALEDLPMLAQVKDICADRNAWIPTQGPHPHAPPQLDDELIERRWREGRLLEGEHLEDP